MKAGNEGVTTDDSYRKRYPIDVYPPLTSWNERVNCTHAGYTRLPATRGSNEAMSLHHITLGARDQGVRLNQPIPFTPHASS